MTVVLQTASALTAGGASSTLSLAGVTPGDVLMVTTANNNSLPSSVVTTAGSTTAWVILVSATINSPTGANVAIYVATALSSSVTVQINYVGGSAGQFGILEVLGSSTTGNGTNSNTSFGNASISTGSVTPTLNGDLAVAVAYATTGVITAGPGGTWTNLGITGASGKGGLTAYQVLPDETPVSATFTYNSGFYAAAAIGLLQPGGQNIVMIA